MNILALLALLISIVAAGLILLTGINTLSGPFEGRTCLTDCVLGYYYAGFAAAAVGLLLSLVTFRNPKSRFMSIVAFLISAGIVGLVGFLYVAGNFF